MYSELAFCFCCRLLASGMETWYDDAERREKGGILAEMNIFAPMYGIRTVQYGTVEERILGG